MWWEPSTLQFVLCFGFAAMNICSQSVQFVVLIFNIYSWFISDVVPIRAQEQLNCSCRERLCLFNQGTYNTEVLDRVYITSFVTTHITSVCKLANLEFEDLQRLFQYCCQFYVPQSFLTSCLLKECIETQNVGKAQAMVALPSLAPCSINHLEKIVRNNRENLGYS